MLLSADWPWAPLQGVGVVIEIRGWQRCLLQGTANGFTCRIRVAHSTACGASGRAVRIMEVEDELLVRWIQLDQDGAWPTVDGLVFAGRPPSVVMIQMIRGRTEAYKVGGGMPMRDGRIKDQMTKMRNNSTSMPHSAKGERGAEEKRMRKMRKTWLLTNCPLWSVVGLPFFRLLAPRKRHVPRIISCGQCFQPSPPWAALTVPDQHHRRCTSRCATTALRCL